MKDARKRSAEHGKFALADKQPAAPNYRRLLPLKRREVQEPGLHNERR